MMNDSDRKMLLGFLLGASVGIGTVLLLDPGKRSRLRAFLIDGADEIAALVGTLGQGRYTRRERKAERADRRLLKRIDDIRSSGL